MLCVLALRVLALRVLAYDWLRALKEVIKYNVAS